MEDIVESQFDPCPKRQEKTACGPLALYSQTRIPARRHKDGEAGFTVFPHRHSGFKQSVESDPKELKPRFKMYH